MRLDTLIARHRWRGTTLAGAVLLLTLAPLALDRLCPLDLSRYRTRSLELTDHAGVAVQMTISRDGMWRLPAMPGTVSPMYLALLLKREDRRFWWHPGVDPVALLRAAGQLATRGHIVSGGSTLTMQVARLLTPHRHSLRGKLLDIVRALQLEAHYSKTEILSMYLTLAPMGGNIEGVAAASALYFGKRPAALDPFEAAELVALPRAPARLRPDRYPERLRDAAAAIAGVTELPPGRLRPPGTAPHLAERLGGQGLDGIVRTTLDARLQTAAAALAARQAALLGAPANLAMLVVDNRDRSVLAYVGGQSYLAPAGMVDMVRAERSPGSALKPFIYALAFDETLVRPETIIDDEPVQYDGYAPHNFDRMFHGSVTVREALQQSYNLPAVEVLRALGPQHLSAMLRQAGARLVLPVAAGEPGLPIALGGLAIDLEDLTMLYAGLADGGEFAPLRLRPEQPQAAPQRLLTQAASGQIGDILANAPAPDGVGAARTRSIAFKTGTSYGFRDAWAVGYSPSYTVGVWVGRNDGSARPGAFGRDTAAPVLFQLFDLLPEEQGAPPGRPATLDRGIAHLAPALGHFRPEAAGLGHSGAGPRILFPPAGATIEAIDPARQTARPVALEAAGGRPPYRWLIDGVPLPARPGDRIDWSPAGRGFDRVSVIDSRNESVSETIRVE